MAMQFCCSYNCNMSCKGRGNFIYFLWKSSLSSVNLNFLWLSKVVRFFGSSLQSSELWSKKWKHSIIHIFFHKSIKAALLNQEETTCCFNATLRKYFSLLRLLCIVIMCKNIIRIFKRGWMERSTLQRYPFIESRSMASLSKCNALLMPYLQPSILD